MTKYVINTVEWNIMDINKLCLMTGMEWDCKRERIEVLEVRDKFSWEK